MAHSLHPAPRSLSRTDADLSDTFGRRSPRGCGARDFLLFLRRRLIAGGFSTTTIAARRIRAHRDGRFAGSRSDLGRPGRHDHGNGLRQRCGRIDRRSRCHQRRLSECDVTRRNDSGTCGGGADVVVTNPDGQGSRMASAFTYQVPVSSPPSIASIGPTSGPHGRRHERRDHWCRLCGGRDRVVWRDGGECRERRERDLDKRGCAVGQRRQR